MYLDVIGLKQKSFFREIWIANESHHESSGAEKKGSFIGVQGRKNFLGGIDSRDSRGNRGVIYRGVALDKFISVSKENTLDTHNAAKLRASIPMAINNLTWCRMSRMRGG